MISYLQKHSFCSAQISEPSNPRVNIIVVIPCFNEPDLISSLESLWKCSRPQCDVEVIVVINASKNSSPEIILQNEKSFEESNHWIENNSDDSLRIFLIKNNSLPEKHAGVGLARKIGMDEAVRRFANVNNKDGLIVCFDADSTCEKNYLVEIENHFKKFPHSPGCSIYFEHPVFRPETFAEEISGIPKVDPKINEGIIQYELFLRYYRQGLKFAGHPFSFHTIGSSMAVRADAYCKQGGMNKRKAGEDFYFLQKIFALGNFSEINSTCVIPSPRPSLRVPFGTGRAINDFIEKKEEFIQAYHPETFVDLKKFCERIPELAEIENFKDGFDPLPHSIKKFLLANDFEKNFREIKKNSSSAEMFLKRFYRWFDGFRVLKFVHFVRDQHTKNTNETGFNGFPEIQIAEAAKKLLVMKKNLIEKRDYFTFDLLDIYRQMDKAKT